MKNFRVTFSATQEHIDVTAADQHKAIKIGANYLGARGYEKELSVRELPRAKAELDANSEAELVLAALDTGNWKLERAQPSAIFTKRANEDNAWMVSRHGRLYCAVREGAGYGQRHWFGPTALKALQNAASDLQVPLVVPAEGERS